MDLDESWEIFVQKWVFLYRFGRKTHSFDKMAYKSDIMAWLFYAFGGGTVIV